MKSNQKIGLRNYLLLLITILFFLQKKVEIYSSKNSNERSSMARFNFTSSRGERSWMEKIQGSRQSRDFARKRVHTNVQRHVCLFLGVEIRITGKRNPRFLRRPPLPPPPFPPSLLLLLLLLMLLASPEPALTRIIIFPIPDESFVTKLPREGSPPFSALSEPICLETPLGLPCYGWSRPNPREIAL